MMAIAGGRPFLRRDVRGAFSVAGSKFQTQPTTMPPPSPHGPIGGWELCIYAIWLNRNGDICIISFPVETLMAGWIAA